MLHRISSLAVLSLRFTACQKQGASASGAGSPLIASAKAFFTDSLSHQQPASNTGWPRLQKTPDWARASVVRLGEAEAVLVPVTYAQDVLVATNFTGNGRHLNLSGLTALVLYRRGGAMQAELVTSLPDAAFAEHPSGRFTGIKIIEDWQGRLLARYQYKPDGNILKSSASAAAAAPPAPGTSAAISDNMIIVTDYYIEGYNYSPDDPDGGEYWEEYAGSSYTYIPDNPGGGGGATPGDGGGAGGGGYYNLPPAGGTQLYPEQASPTAPVSDVAGYFHCFTYDPSASYSVSVCVDQPFAGSRTPWTSSVYDYLVGTSDNPVNVGHTFLVLTENSSNGTVTRNIGFYPSTYPYGTVAGVYNNDGLHAFNVSASFQVTPDMFYNITNYISAGPQGYNLSTNNCTTFALNALSQGHIYLPSTTGSWLGGMGNDPGDLGEDIQVSNAPGIQKNTLPAGHANAGDCQ